MRHTCNLAYKKRRAKKRVYDSNPKVRLGSIRGLQQEFGEEEYREQKICEWGRGSSSTSIRPWKSLEEIHIERKLQLGEIINLSEIFLVASSTRIKEYSGKIIF